MAKKKAAKKGVMLLVGSKVKEQVKKSGMMMAGELLAALNDTVMDGLKRAVERAKLNNRRTVQARDV